MSTISKARTAAAGAPTYILGGPKNWAYLGADALPWYPAMRLFQAASIRDWGPALAAIGEALAGVASGADPMRAAATAKQALKKVA